MVDMELESMFTAILNFFYYGENLEIHGYVQSDFSEQGISVTEKKILDRGLYEKSTCLKQLSLSLSTIIQHLIYKKKNLNLKKTNSVSNLHKRKNVCAKCCASKKAVTRKSPP